MEGPGEHVTENTDVNILSKHSRVHIKTHLKTETLLLYCTETLGWMQRHTHTHTQKHSHVLCILYRNIFLSVHPKKHILAKHSLVKTSTGTLFFYTVQKHPKRNPQAFMTLRRDTDSEQVWMQPRTHTLGAQEED